MVELSATKSLKRMNLLRGMLGGAPVANESMWPDGAWTNVWGLNSRKRYIIERDTPFVRPVYAQFGGLGEGAPAQESSLRWSLQKTSGGTAIRGTFDGQINGKISPYGFMIGDPIFGPFTAGQQIWISTFASGPTIYYQGTSNVTVSAWGEGCDAATNAAASDRTIIQGFSNNAVSHVSPIALVGDEGAGLPFIVVMGDSIPAGLGDTASVVDAGRGYMRRALDNAYPFLNLCQSGEAFTHDKNRRLLLCQCATDVWSGYGINDIKSGASLATIQANARSDWVRFGAGGARVHQATATPYTTSSDTWATTTNQTVTAYETIKQGFNAWLRDGAPESAGVAVAVGASGIRAGETGHPLYAIHDVAIKVEVDNAGTPSLTGGKWAVGSIYTTDGTGLHPNSTGNAAMATGVDTTKFSAW